MRNLFVYIVALIFFVKLGYSQEVSVETGEGFEVFTSSSSVGNGDTEGYSVFNLPNPKEKGQNYFVSNPDQILTVSTVQELDAIAEEIEHRTKVEYVIVIVDDYVGDNDFDFAHTLFEQWGIGKSESNNGLLLFIAKKRHEYRFISGYGIEGIMSDALLKRIGEIYLVPNFRHDDYDKGVIEVSNFIAKVLQSPESVEELMNQYRKASSFWSLGNPILVETGWILLLFVILYSYIHIISKTFLKQNAPRLIVPIFQGMGCMVGILFISVFIFAFVFNNIEEVYQRKNLPYFALILASLILSMKITDGRTRIKKEFNDAEEREKAYKKYLILTIVPIIMTPLAWGDLILILKSMRNNNGRFTPPDESGDWRRIVRRNPKVEDKGLLSQGQRKEEIISSRKYEIWKNTRTGEHLLTSWEINNKYKKCTQCGFYTLELNMNRVIRNATYSVYGEGEQFDKCHNCSYRLHKRYYTIPKKERSSSSGSGSSSSGGSSSSSSGSFGGGSSGGGGAGGRW